jgi:hypothetical protein
MHSETPYLADKTASICCGKEMRRYWTEDGRLIGLCRSCDREVALEALMRFKGDGWIGVDLDGTLASDSVSNGWEKIGLPVPAMLQRVKRWLLEGRTVKIFTARAAVPSQIKLVKDWLQRQGLPDLEVTNVKDFGMAELWDDRCVPVEANSGEVVTSSKVRARAHLKPRLERRLAEIFSGRANNRFIASFRGFLAL